MNDSDVTYVVFCRIDGIKELPSDKSAAAVAALAGVVAAAAVTDTGEHLPVHSSVYGRFVLVPEKVRNALDLAKRLLKGGAAAGVHLQIGVACGPVEATPDLFQHNVAGTVVNRAARLAHLHDGTRRIAVDERVAEAARHSNTNF